MPKVSDKNISDKKKKKTYKQMMAEILKGNKEKKIEPTGIGGGKFEKITKI
jgi:hypothetical protein